MTRVFSSLFQVIGILSVGLFVRYRLGSAMFDPFFFIPFACLSAILAGPLLTKSYAQSQAPISVQVRKAVTRACAWMSLILLVSILSLNLMPWSGGWLLPEWTTALDAALLSLTSTTALALIMSLLLLRLPPGVAKWFFRALVFGGILLYRAVPPEWSNGTIQAVIEHGLSIVALTLAAALALLDAGLLRIVAGSGNKT
jgi:drug/metabolite transporter (DMT)-like permease